MEADFVWHPLPVMLWQLSPSPHARLGTPTGSHGQLEVIHVVPIVLNGMVSLAVRPRIVYSKICYQWQVVGGDECRSAPVKHHTIYCQGGIEVYVVQVEERHNTWVCPRAAQMGSNIDGLKLPAEQACG